jgi:hypothetical protein
VLSLSLASFRSPSGGPVAEIRLPISAIQYQESGTDVANHFVTGRFLISECYYLISKNPAQRLRPKIRYFLRCEIIRSVRLLLRVFLPNVGKAHGVTG